MSLLLYPIDVFVISFNNILFRIAGDVGISPAAATFITGFSLVLDASGTFSTSAQVIGDLQAASYTSPTPDKLTTAIVDMEIAYTDASGRPNPDQSELGNGVYLLSIGVGDNPDALLKARLVVSR